MHSSRRAPFARRTACGLVAPNSTLPSTVSHGKSDLVYCWKTYTMPAGGRTTGPPLNDTAPREGAMSPASMRRIVDLPQPEGPNRLTKRPRGIWKLMSSTAVTAPKLLPTPSTAISGWTSASNFMDERFRLDRLLEHAFLLH